MKKELQIFFTAVSYYTRIPVPALLPYSADFLNSSNRYITLIGWVVGAFSFSIFYLTNYIWGISIALILSIAASILFTGALHEDGFADVCDGFGGGFTKDRILEIMKDSSLGTYGTIGIVFIIALKFLALQQILNIAGNEFWILLLIFIVSNAISRFIAISLIYSYPYVGKEGVSKAKPATENPDIHNLWIALSFILIPLTALIVLSHKPWLLLMIVPLLIQRQAMGKYFKRKIGGYTGDCLGAVQQVAELIIYMSIIAIWKFI
ncbi:adenosylcobinamide-GDP ribazoletransferase [Mucilaginibacter aquaedulcis]|uniref:adenosylcobinamide-GDP ribazoletransferase n=1 Tax=Mucilaginibacter aquaedulcis TaxID=1187081 RepID=UPI0025B5BEEC|nr:adenosylcobinamide-GDP ribazoletransferase [Mucilaginibacter aquaedulcis]MDN3548204.1 adenosylcobinamide-GDP ribazoletransferase [Mucilaginibacter aquaedulcis]